MVRLAQRQLIEQAVFALAQCVDSTPHRRAALPDIEVESFSKAVLILQPHAVKTCAIASWVPNTTRCVTPTRRRRRYDLPTGA